MSQDEVRYEHMYEHLFDGADPDRTHPEPVTASDADPEPVTASDADESPLAKYMTAYQKQRQAVYNRARHLVDSPHRGMRHHVEDAKAEAGLVEAEAQISRARGTQLKWVQSLLRANTAGRLGYRSPTDLIVSRADVHRSTARELLYLAKRLADHQIDDIREGKISYVRVLEETRLSQAGASEDEIVRSKDMDLDKVKKTAQRHRKISRDDERREFDGQYVTFQPSLDNSHVRMSGRMGAYEAEICRQGLDKRGEDLVPKDADRPDPGLRRALALTSLCQDALDETSPNQVPDTGTPKQPNRRAPLLMAVAHDPIAQDSDYEQGAAILAGARVGPDTVDLIRCLGGTEKIIVTDQVVTTYGRTTTIRPALRRGVLARDDGCTIAGCSSTYRLEVHHITERSKGGTDAPENLTTLCWWHHHVAVHRQGMRIDPNSPPHRRRLLPPRRACRYRSRAADPDTLAILRALHTPPQRDPP